MHKHWREYAEMHSLEALSILIVVNVSMSVTVNIIGRCPKGLTPEEEDSL